MLFVLIVQDKESMVDSILAKESLSTLVYLQASDVQSVWGLTESVAEAFGAWGIIVLAMTTLMTMPRGALLSSLIWA